MPPTKQRSLSSDVVEKEIAVDEDSSETLKSDVASAAGRSPNLGLLLIC